MPLRALLLPPSASGLFAVDRLGPLLAERGVRVLALRGASVEATLERAGVAQGDAAVLATTVPGVEAAYRTGLVALALHRTEAPEPFHAAGARAVYRDLPAFVDNLAAGLVACAPHEISLTNEQLDAWMATALAEAERGRAEGEVPIGSILVRGFDGALMGRGRNRANARHSATAHAEMEAFRDAEKREAHRRSDLILITTLEPCLMCFGAALAARVDTIVYALPAPPNGALGRVGPLPEGATRPRILSGIRAHASRDLLEAHAEAHPGGFSARLVASLGESRSKSA